MILFIEYLKAFCSFYKIYKLWRTIPSKSSKLLVCLVKAISAYSEDSTIQTHSTKEERKSNSKLGFLVSAIHDWQAAFNFDWDLWTTWRDGVGAVMRSLRCLKGGYSTLYGDNKVEVQVDKGYIDQIMAHNVVMHLRDSWIRSGELYTPSKVVAKAEWLW